MPSPYQDGDESANDEGKRPPNEPTGEQVVDWTWEREWRVHCDELRFSPAEASIIVPNEEWASKLCRSHDAEQEMVVELYSAAIEREDAELRREPFLWRITPLQ